MKPHAIEYKTIIFKAPGFKPDKTTQRLIPEEPLSIRIDGKPYSVVMRTPGDELAHAAGFCLSEGIIDSAQDIETIGYCTEDNINVATVTLIPERRKAVSRILERKGFVSQTSCGICGKEIIDDICQVLFPIPISVGLTPHEIFECVDQLTHAQPLYAETRSAHAAMILDAEKKPLASAEDVGRHNALDKALGKALLAGSLGMAKIAVLSSRLSYELVQKAARGRIEIIVGISRPTALAIELAGKVGMTIACAKKNTLMVFGGEHRIKGLKEI